MDKSKALPAKVKIKKIYEEYNPQLNAIMLNIYHLLKTSIKLSSQPTYKNRIKSFNSYYKKIIRKKAEEAALSSSLVCLTDMIGIRIICTFLEDISLVRQQLEEMFKIREIEIKGEDQKFKEFGYESVHVLIEIPKSCLPPEDSNHPLPEDLCCEIQIRTILQDAWAEVEHELIYKTEFTPFDMPLRRKLASMNASLSLADIIFQEIRDYQKKLQSEMNERRESFYSIADEITSKELGTKHNYKEKPIERINPFVRGTIDDLILKAIEAHNTGNLDTAILIYTKIIDSKPTPNNEVLSTIYKHRGMAYFSENDYDSALGDFEASYKASNKNFRSVYYEGIVYSIKKDFQKALECFNLSLEINSFQSHAYYRRAIAYYELKQYELSMADVVQAQNMGLEDDGLKSLHDKLVEKFDMKV